ncbi:MAG: MazG nucleotide pyrophosphohydrolase domain-containing protein [Alphaproteobacteria bacterium]|nr:MazG nucleotide pyrophosphohydrolase domain-containing protein [Alphaproteobacteria bacterium]
MPGPTLKTLQDRVGAVSDIYAERFDINRDEAWHLAKLNEELGELVQAYLKATGRGRAGNMTANELREGLENEVADLFAQVMLFAAWQKIDVGDALERKWFKYL